MTVTDVLPIGANDVRPTTNVLPILIIIADTGSTPRTRIYRPHMLNFFALLFMLYSTAAYDSYKFEQKIQIQSNDLNSLAASTQEKLLAKSSSKVE